ncbi:MAG: DUF4169 family protein [Porphyrobacter sp.]|nr:DUF4169 family protein [Porphyrobacter sp.]
MAEIVNLRTARKAKLRVKKEVEASANRLKFGKTKGEKAQTIADKVRAARQLDGAKLERD